MIFKLDFQNSDYQNKIINSYKNFQQSLSILNSENYLSSTQTSSKNDECTFKNHLINEISSSNYSISESTLNNFKQNLPEACKSIFLFVLDSLQQSLKRYSTTKCLIIKPINQDLISSDFQLQKNIWNETMKDFNISKEDLKSFNYIIIPLVSNSNKKENFGIAFINMEKNYEHVEIFSGLSKSNLYSKNSSFYFIR